MLLTVTLGSQAVFTAGENLLCNFTFHNSATTNPSQADSNNAAVTFATEGGTDGRTKGAEVEQGSKTAQQGAPQAPSLKEQDVNVLWCSVQIIGSLAVDPAVVKADLLSPLKNKAMYAAGGSRSGGGTLGTISSQQITSAAGGKPRTEDRWIPVFSTPPSVLFTNLQLAPGESRNFTYQIALPPQLPPSHKGKASTFSYRLHVGTQYGGVFHPTHTARIPFRVFNEVPREDSLPSYDVSNPIILYKDTAKVEDSLITNSSNNITATSASDVFVRKKDSKDQTTSSPARSTSSDDGPDAALPRNFRTILGLCQSMNKLNYEISKNSEKVAQVYLFRTIYRLGEIVNGIINFSRGSIPCYQISITLETSESVESPFANRQKQEISRTTRRVYAEHHEFCLNTRRTSFALCIPTTSTPEFVTSAVGLQWSLRIEFFTGTRDRPWVSIDGETDEMHHLEEAAKVVDMELFNCRIPIRVLPTSAAEGKLFGSVHRYEIT